MSLGPLYVILGEVSVQVLCPFFNWVVQNMLLMGDSNVRKILISGNKLSNQCM